MRANLILMVVGLFIIFQVVTLSCQLVKEVVSLNSDLDGRMEVLIK